MNPRKSLMAQFLLGGLILILCVATLVVSQRHASTLQMELVNWQSLANTLEVDVLNLQQQAQHYKLNAPRDFESYNRDVAVFYQQFQQQLTTISETYDRMYISVSEMEKSWLGMWVLSGDTPMLNAIENQTNWGQFWNTFIGNLNEQIGDVNEPRLEWAADHILATQENVAERLATLKSKVEIAGQWFSQTYQSLSWVFSFIVMGIIVAILSAFALVVIRPIVSTTKVCQAVAAGDYGRKVALNGTGETKQLQEAFNELSSRSKLLMDLIGDINKPSSVPSKLKSIYDSGKDALNCSWIGLMAFDDDRANLHSSVPAALDKNFKHRHVTLNKSFGRDLLKAVETKWLDLPELRQLSMKRHDERFLRELHKNTMARHIVGYSFKCPKHNEFILMFACNLPEGFSQQQIELIKTLAATMADGIIAGLDYVDHKQAA